MADFSGTPTTGQAPLTVNFTDLSTGSPTSWSWNFGDGGTSTLQNPSHTYSAAGQYTVSLTATNSAGPDSTTKTNYITVSATVTPPVADFSGTPTTGQAPLTVNFTDLVDRLTHELELDLRGRRHVHGPEPEPYLHCRRAVHGQSHGHQHRGTEHGHQDELHHRICVRNG